MDSGSDGWRPWRRDALGLLAVLTIVPLFVGLHAVAAEPRVFELATHRGTLPEDQQVIRVHQGDEVTLRWTVDAPLTIHLHGYDIEKRVTPPGPSVMQFRARATGRFPIAIHGSPGAPEVVLGYLEVYPR